MSDRMGAVADLSNAFDVPLDQGYDRRLDQTWPGRLAQDAMGAVLAPGQALQSTEPITTEQMIKPAADLAGLVTGGSYAKPAMKDASGMGIRAYHSSPHDFDKFDLSKIGTGEGAQAYGHGLYFAESPKVSGQGGDYWKYFLNRFKGPEHSAAKELQTSGFDRDLAISKLNQEVEDRLRWAANDPKSGEYLEEAAAQAQRQLNLLRSGKPVGPRTYEVDINADPAHLLDWEKTLTQQPQALRELSSAHPELKKYFELAPEARGDVAYNQGLGGGRKAAETLREAGIPGIKYLDRGSRGQLDIEQLKSRLAGLEKRDVPDIERIEALKRQIADYVPPSSNYVIFDPNLIRIDKKYGIPAALGAGGMGALAAQDTYQPAERRF